MSPYEAASSADHFAPPRVINEKMIQDRDSSPSTSGTVGSVRSLRPHELIGAYKWGASLALMLFLFAVEVAVSLPQSSDK